MKENHKITNICDINAISRKKFIGYSHAIAEEICSGIACSSKSIKELCKEHTHWPSDFTIFKWIRENEDFARQYARAKMAQITVLVDEILDIAANAKDVNKAKLEIDTRKWLACKLVPKIYGNRVEATDNEGLNHDQWLTMLTQEEPVSD